MAPLKIKNKNVELMNLYWTTAGVYPGVAETGPYDFQERVESAARAGFKGIGIWHADLQKTLQKRDIKEIKTILGDNGIKHVELEFLTDWFVEGPHKINSDRWKKMLFETSQTLNAKHIKVGDFNNTTRPMSKIIESFVELCEEAKKYNAIIGFEFMPSAMIDNLNDALTLVETAGADNGGLIIDIAHLFNKGTVLEELKRLPLKYIVNVELNDGFLPDSPRHDPSGARRFCGEGEFDIKGFIKCLIQMGYDGPWAVEIFSDEVLKMPLEEINRKAFATTIEQFNI